MMMMMVMVMFSIDDERYEVANATLQAATRSLLLPMNGKLASERKVDSSAASKPDKTK